MQSSATRCRKLSATRAHAFPAKLLNPGVKPGTWQASHRNLRVGDVAGLVLGVLDAALVHGAESDQASFSDRLLGFAHQASSSLFHLLKLDGRSISSPKTRWPPRSVVNATFVIMVILFGAWQPHLSSQ
jgi:hypothetical protein